MTRENTTSMDATDGESTAPDNVAIEGNLPLTAIDIESQKDITGGRGHSLRYVHKWFAARPTPAARLAIIASAYPGDIGSDELLNLMQSGPKALDTGIAEYVEDKFNEDKNSRDSVDEHYGYPNPNTQTPTETELTTLHEKIKSSWGGELPTVLDPTSGRGIIPFESMRYGFPTVANELNPVPALITKVALEYAPEVQSITPEINEWRDKIHDTAKENLQEYYPSTNNGNEVLHSAFTYIITCKSCGGEIPLVDKWWLSSNNDSVIIPQYDNKEVTFEHAKIQNAPDDFNPKGGPVNRADAECPHCGVVTNNTDIRSRIHDNEFEYRVYGVNYKTPDGERQYRAGKQIDNEAMQAAAERVESDFNIMDFLSEPIQPGRKTREIRSRGIKQWCDMFTPRQLITHYELLQAYNEYKHDIIEQYRDKKAELILTILTFGASRLLQDQNRSVPWRYDRGYGDDIFTDNNLAMKRTAGDNNPVAPRKGYKYTLDRIVDRFEEVASQSNKQNTTEVICGDAANFTTNTTQDNVDIAVVDPPYYSSIMYAELSDIFYVLQKEYLSDVHPDLFDRKLTNKDDEAVANPSQFDGLSGDKSKKQMADDDYESKMNDIFSEIHNALSENGVMTVMFTHREMEAWDTLTSALIESGFIITATHPIKTERKDRIGMRGSNSADSSIFLTARKSGSDVSSISSLWSDIEEKIYATARKEAKDIINSDYHISKTDAAIAAYGPTLEKFVKAHPVVDKNGNELRPREALSKARQAVTSVLVEEYLNVNGVDTIDSLTRWYILIWLIYENDTVISDEARQVGRAADIDIDNVDARSDTKIWGKSSGDLQLKKPSERIQDIVKLESEDADNPSSNTYPVDPTSKSFQNAIDAVHSAVHVYNREGSDRALQWLKERNMDTETEVHITIIALLETMPSGYDIQETLQKLVQGQTGEYLDIDLTTFSSTADPQTDVSEWINDNDE